MSDYPYSHATPAEAETDGSGRHPVSVGHLVMGVAFLGLATIWLLVETDAVGSDDLRWFLPLPWLAAGLAGLLAVALTGRRAKTHVDATPSHVEPEPSWAEPDVTDVTDPSDELHDVDEDGNTSDVR